MTALLSPLRTLACAVRARDFSAAELALDDLALQSPYDEAEIARGRCAADRGKDRLLPLDHDPLTAIAAYNQTPRPSSNRRRRA